MEHNAETTFSDMVEATRMGNVFASNVRAYNRWRNRPKNIKRRRALSPVQLEHAVMHVSRQFPENVIRGAA